MEPDCPFVSKTMFELLDSTSKTQISKETPTCDRCRSRMPLCNRYINLMHPQYLNCNKDTIRCKRSSKKHLWMPTGNRLATTSNAKVHEPQTAALKIFLLIAGEVGEQLRMVCG